MAFTVQPNIPGLVDYHLPEIWRQGQIRSLIIDLLRPLKDDWVFFVREQDRIRRRAVRPAQTLVLIAHLNDLFDPVNRQITIVTNTPGEFEVQKPTTANIVGDLLNQFEAAIELYRPPGTVFSVSTFVP